MEYPLISLRSAKVIIVVVIIDVANVIVIVIDVIVVIIDIATGSIVDVVITVVDVIIIDVVVVVGDITTVTGSIVATSQLVILRRHRRVIFKTDNLRCNVLPPSNQHGLFVKLTSSLNVCRSALLLSVKRSSSCPL